MILQLLFLVMISIFLPRQEGATAQSTALTKPNCTSVCGNVTIPFPFGIEKGCSADSRLDINCSSSKPFITLRTNKTFEVLDISLDGTMRVNFPVCKFCGGASKYFEETVFFDDQDSSPIPFLFSQSGNKFYGVGCGNFSFIANDDSVIASCLTTCDENSSTRSGNSCQADVDSPFKRVYPIFYFDKERGCNNSYAFLGDQQWLDTDLKNPQNVQNLTHVPVVLDWRVFKIFFDPLLKEKSRAYESTSTCEISACSCFSGLFPTVQCKCSPGYGGNPYLLEGCQDIDECKANATVCKTSEVCENSIGSYNCIRAKLSPENSKVVALLGVGAGLGGMFLLVAVWWLSILIKKRRDIKMRERHFKKNGGLLIQQQLTSSDGSVDRSKLFSSKDLDKATDHFNVNRILGQGGQGTVYKGMLEDGRIVAVKMSKATNEGKIDEFINEVVILSQINHRNVVKLLGFCLETEVPLLVYEFIPNGTLSHYLHDETEELPLTWDMRLRIATEVAEALSYLHFAASIPIYHRDIKSTNILLDEKYRAKVADFGTSKSIAIDQTHVTTKVLGTFGYLDPEYFQSSQFTDKSDVYSFGVVLVELLTGQKPISSTRSEECRGLASYFIVSMEENNLYDILDIQVVKQGKKEDIMTIANLAKRCLNLDGRRRPTMKEVAVQLEAIFRASQNDGNFQQNYDEVEYTRTEVIESWDIVSASTGSTFDNIPSSIDAQPLLTKGSL